jgi:hypothetical protein
MRRSAAVECKRGSDALDKSYQNDAEEFKELLSERIRHLVEVGKLSEVHKSENLGVFNGRPWVSRWRSEGLSEVDFPETPTGSAVLSIVDDLLPLACPLPFRWRFDGLVADRLPEPSATFAALLTLPASSPEVSAARFMFQ